MNKKSAFTETFLKAANIDPNSDLINEKKSNGGLMFAIKTKADYD
jgi:hypothetical protein